MKIVYDHQIFSSQKYGGVSRYFFELYKGMNCLGEKADIVAPFRCNNYLFKEKIDKSKHIEYFPKINRLIQPINNILSKPIITNIAPDVIHETYYQYGLSSNGNTPILLTAYDTIHEKYYEYFRLKDSTTLRKRAALSRADHIIAISESTRQDYINFFNINPNKITTILLGCNINSNKTNELSKLLNKPYILYVGSRSGYKNFDTFLKAFFSKQKISANYDLLCYGGGTFNNFEIELIRNLSKGSHTKITQEDGDDLKLNYAYSNASLFVYPSKYEGFGLPPIEAMANNCPVVCSNTSSMPEVVGDAAILFNPNSIDEIAQVMLSVLEDSELNSKLIKLGRKRANQLTWGKCVDDTLNLYRKIIL